MFFNFQSDFLQSREASEEEIVDVLKEKLNSLLDDEDVDPNEIERVCNNLTSHGFPNRL